MPLDPRERHPFRMGQRVHARDRSGTAGKKQPGGACPKVEPIARVRA